MPVRDPIDVEIVRAEADSRSEPEAIDLAPPADEAMPEDQIAQVSEEQVRRAARLVANVLVELLNNPDMALNEFESQEIVPVWTGAINKSLRFRRIFERSDEHLALGGTLYFLYRRGRALARQRSAVRSVEREQRDVEGGEQRERPIRPGKQFYRGE